MNTEKIEKLKKGLSNSQISDSIKVKIQEQIDRLEKEDANEVPVIKQELEAPIAKEEVQTPIIEKKPIAIKKVATKKVVAKKTIKAIGKKQPKKVLEPKVVAPKANNIMSVAKSIQKDGESWKDALGRAKQVLAERKTDNVKEKESELKKLLALIRRRKDLKEIVGRTHVERDLKRDALPSGKRFPNPDNKNTKHPERAYYENRPNRTDNFTFGKYKLEDGGGVNNDDDERFIKTITAQFNHIISLKTVSEKRETIQNILNNIDDYAGSIIQKRITADNLKYALTQKTVSSINNALKTSLSALDNGDSFEKGGSTNDEVAEIYISGHPYYIKKMGDSTHFKLANSRDGVDVVIGSHIGQHRGEEYYDDIYDWLRGGKNPNGNQYKSKYYANGGSLPFMTDPNFGSFQNTGAFANGGETDGYTLNKTIEFTTSDEDSYLSGNVGGDMMDLIDVEKIGDNKYSAIAKSYSVAFEGLKGQELEDEIYNQINEMFATNDSIDVDLESIEIIGKKYADGGEIKSVVDAIFEFNEKRGKLNTSFGAKTKEGLTALIENDNYTSEEIANSIFQPNNKKGKINTSWGEKYYIGLQDMIERARGEEFAKGGSLNSSEVDKLWNGYASAVLFTETDSDSGEPLDSEYSISDFDKKTVTSSKKMLAEYYSKNKDAIEESGLDLDTIGNDIWYTRSGQGAGFFDHSLDEEVEEKLTKGAEALGEYPNVETYDGEISVRGGRVFAKGGRLNANYIPKRDIDSITTNYGQTIDGDKLLDGAYTKAKLQKPKMSRTQFEDESYEYAKGGDLYEKGKNYPVKNIPASDCDKYGLDEFPNFSKTGSISGMKKQYYGKDALLVKCGNYIYNVTSQPEIYFNGAYELGGSFAPNVSNGTQFMNGVYADGGSIKPFDFSDTKIWIGDNPELSKIVQEKAFEKGYRWSGSEDFVQNTDKKTMFFNGANKSIFFGDDDRKQFNESTYFKEVTEQDIFGGQATDFMVDVDGGGIINLDNVLAKSSSTKIEYFGGYFMTNEQKNNEKISYLESFMEKIKLYSDLVFLKGKVGLGFNFKGTKQELKDKLTEVSKEMKKMGVVGDLYPINKTQKSVYDRILSYGFDRFANGGYFAPNVSNGTQFMNGVYADGGDIKTFKIGDKVKFARSGVFGWEEIDEAEQAGYDMGNDTFTVTEVDNTKGEEAIKLNDEDTWVNPKHFDLETNFAKGGSIQKVPARIKERLEELREEIREERISTGEILELESLKEYIDPSDVELLEWAGVEEFPEDEEDDNDDYYKYAKGGDTNESKIARESDVVGFLNKKYSLNLSNSDVDIKGNGKWIINADVYSKLNDENLDVNDIENEINNLFRRGSDVRGIVEKSFEKKSKWVYKLYFADLFDGLKSWRKNSNYNSEYFDTKTEAQEQMNKKIDKIVSDNNMFAKGGKIKPFEYEEKGSNIMINGTKEDVKRMYLDYINNFLTVEKFAEHYNISEKQANSIIESGRIYAEEDGHFAKGGRLNANYIPRRDIDSITTNYGQTIDGDKLLDGAYTKAKLQKPKMSRTQFEDESYEYAKGGAVGDLSGNYYSTTDFVEQNKLMDLAKSTFGQYWESGGDYDYDVAEIKLLIEKLGGGYKVIYVDSENREKFENAKSKYLPLLDKKSNDGDIFVIQNNKMSDGGEINEYYEGMTKEDIISKTIVFDNNGKTYDRYTVYTPDGSVFGMSEDAKGFNLYIGEKNEIPMGKHLGKKLASVPKDIEWAVLDRMKEEYANGGGIEKSNSLKHFILNEASSGSIANKIPYSDYKSIDGVRSTAIQILNRDGDRPYSLKAYIDLIQEALEEYEENKREMRFANGGDKLLDGAYTKAKLQKPKMSRTQFEEESYEYAKGGSVGEELMGGQSNSSLKPSGYHLVSAKGREIIVSDDGGKSKERWVKNNGYSGYRLVYKGNDYEFTNSFEGGGSFAPNVSNGTQFMNGVYAKGGSVNSSKKLENGVYRVGKPTKVSPILYEQKIVEIFANGDISTASDYGRKLADFKHQKYPIINKEQLQAQYKMAKGGSVDDSVINELWNGYASAVLFTEMDSDSGEPLYSEYSVSDFDDKTVKSSKELLRRFYIENKDAIEESGMDLDRIGTDVWYTRAGHRAGFFDHNLDKDVEDKLTKGAEALGELPDVSTYDGKISVTGGKVFAKGGVMAKGGRLNANYIPKRDIDSITTNYGQTIDGDKLLDGAYTKAKLQKPKMSRTQFEEESYEYAKGGKIGEMINSNEWNIYSYGKDFEKEKEVCDTLRKRSSNESIIVEDKGSFYVLLRNHKKYPSKRVYANGGDTGRVIELFPLELIPLSTQLSKITGDQLSTGDYTDEKGNDYSTKSGNIIVHASTGQKFRIPERIYDYVDGYNLVINKANNAIIVYETNAKVADIVDGKLDFSKNDESVSIDTSKVVSEFEKGNIPSAINADEEYKKIERELENLYDKYDNLSEYKTSHTARALDSKIQDYQNILHRLERKYADGGEVDNRHNYMMLSRLKSDCDYYLGYGNRSERSLWADNVDEHIEEMKRLWNNLPKDAKPEWLSMEDILDYEKKDEKSICRWRFNV